MKNNYVIDKVPYDKLGALSQKDYGKIWYCHMRDFPDIPVLSEQRNTQRQFVI